MLAVIFLFSCIHILSATGLECNIYVSSSDVINNTSCWTGGYQTPCATLDLALQGTATDAIQDNYSSSIVIFLSPGTYTLDTSPGLDQQLMGSNVIMRNDNSGYEEVSIMCLNVSSSSYQWLRYAELQSVTLYNCNINSYYAWNDNVVYDGDFCPLSHNNFGGHDLSGFGDTATFKNDQISLSDHYSPWSPKYLIDRNWLKKFMQVGVDVTCMYTNFGGRDLFGFGDTATFKNGQISLSDHGYSPWSS